MTIKDTGAGKRWRHDRPCYLTTIAGIAANADSRHAAKKKPREPKMPTFDVVCKPNQVELKNAVDQSMKEIGTRFDFKGSAAKVEHADKEVTLYADSDFQLGQVLDVLLGKMTKRNVDVRFLDHGKVEKIGGDKVKQVLTIRDGVPQDAAKKIVAQIKASKIKVQASIQGDTVRIQGAKRDDLQTAIALLKKEVTDLPLGYENFRD
jgi:uncharacterized protein YajQ (UPF0234 family)